MRGILFGSLVSCIHSATALLLPHSVTTRPTIPSLQARRTSCANTATSRGCWGNFSVDTNFYEETPNTGVTLEYWLNVQNTTLAPDARSQSRPRGFWQTSDNEQGIERLTLNFNGSIPGPLITANWGDNCNDTIIQNKASSPSSNDRLTLWHSNHPCCQQLGIQRNSDPLAWYETIWEQRL